MNPGRRPTPPPDSDEPHPAILALARLLARAAARDTLADLAAQPDPVDDHAARGNLRPL